MPLPDDQRQLYDDLCAKLAQQQDQAQLMRFIGGVLGSLLRRKGDAQFLRTVQDALASGMAGRRLDQQQALAREVIGMVIAKRPEVALAWQRVSGEQPHPLARRAVDAAPADELPDISLDDATVAADSAEAFERAAVEDLAGALCRRLALFAIPPQRFPSPVYMHEQPFLLASDLFPGVVRDVLAQVLMPLVRDPLAELYRGGGDAVAAVAAMRPELWELVTAQLRVLAERTASARAKLAAARAGEGPEFELVERPVRRERTMSVLGVKFSLGSSTEMAVRKVPVRGAGRPDGDEMLALDLAARMQDVAAAAGLELPADVDLSLLHDLLTFDAERLSRDLPGLLALIGDADAEAQAVLDGISAAAAGQPIVVADALAITLFAHGVNGSFGFEELVRLGNRWGLSDHPLIAAEIARRPRDLAFQVRDALRRRLDRNNMGLAVVMLFEVWRVLAETGQRAAMDAAVSVFSAFPIAFAGDADESTFSDIGATLAKILAAPTLDAAGAIETVMRLYGKVVPASGQRL